MYTHAFLCTTLEFLLPFFNRRFTQTQFKSFGAAIAKVKAAGGAL